MNAFLEMLKEYDQVSLTRLLSIFLVLFYVGVTLYLVLTGRTWGNYDTFTVFTIGLGTGNQLVNKYINSKYNTICGQPGKPIRPVPLNKENR